MGTRKSENRIESTSLSSFTVVTEDKNSPKMSTRRRVHANRRMKRRNEKTRAPSVHNANVSSSSSSSSSSSTNTSNSSSSRGNTSSSSRRSCRNNKRRKLPQTKSSISKKSRKRKRGT